MVKETTKELSVFSVLFNIEEKTKSLTRTRYGVTVTQDQLQAIKKDTKKMENDLDFDRDKMLGSICYLLADGANEVEHENNYLLSTIMTSYAIQTKGYKQFNADDMEHPVVMMAFYQNEVTGNFACREVMVHDDMNFIENGVYDTFTDMLGVSEYEDVMDKLGERYFKKPTGGSNFTPKKKKRKKRK